MAVNHNININLNNGSGSSNLKTSAKKSITSIKNNASKNLQIPKFLSKYNQMVGGTGSLGKLKRFGIAGATAYGLVSTANKGLDIYLDIKQASTGNVVSIGNVRRVKNYIFHPMQYIRDLYQYNILAQMENPRQNYSNNYHRELTGMAIVGNQYGSKR